MCLLYLEVLLAILQMTLISKLIYSTMMQFERPCTSELQSTLSYIFFCEEHFILLSCSFPGSYGWCVLGEVFFL